MSIYTDEQTKYRPGFVAFPSGFMSISIEAFQPRASPNTPETISLVMHEPTSSMKHQKVVEPDVSRREHQRKIQEEGLKAELEYIRLGGRIPRKDTEAGLIQTFDLKAKLTEEERSLLHAWEEYDKAWDRLLLSVRPMKKFVFRKISFTFNEIPWPVLKQFRPAIPLTSKCQKHNNIATLLSLHDLTADNIALFLLHPLRDPNKSRKERLRNAILHYHPDKFSRFLHRVVEPDQDRVWQGIDIIIRALNQLMNG
ncbi:hypothetical protein Clacol_005778 [Clathrus columnatus]|uniref:Uncharacterized protein n=1 Tax=Clathrus columnatus TaxID=1419009 RepID=A0AAV5AFT3_9AGAM|nr:hypothetical protein Clacol_005778 [Clathrus columnatus]